MTKRLNGTGRDKEAKQYPRDPFGWYIESRASVEQLFDTVDFGDALIWDPSCGSGNILDVAATRGHATLGSDVVDRFKPGGHTFHRGNFLLSTRYPSTGFSIVNNPPYNEPEKGIAERFILKAIEDVPFRRAAFLVPLEFQCGQGRFERLYSKHPPSHVVSLMERPSMPPGAEVEALGEKAFKGGMSDYAWLVWSAGGPHRTEHLFARPTAYPDRPLMDRRQQVIRRRKDSK